MQITKILGCITIFTIIAAIACTAFAPTATPTPVPLRNTSFEVNAGTTYRMSLEMDQGTRFEYRMRADLDINVELIDPAGRTVGLWSRVESLRGDHVAATPGVYRMEFDNGYSLFTSKLVDVNYRFVPPGGR